MTRRRLAAGLLLAVAAASAGASGALLGPSPVPAGGGAAGVLAAAAGTAGANVASLFGAERAATDVGPLASSAPVRVTLTLRTRHAAALNRILDGGGHVTARLWASRFGPSPREVAALEHTLRGAGLSASWVPGETLLEAFGPAGAVERFFATAIHRFKPADGATPFFAPTAPLRVPGEIAAEVSAVSGGDDYEAAGFAAVSPGRDGLTPQEISDFYDITPLRSSGLDGSGETVVFPEWAMPDASVLAADAAKFHLPPFRVTVHHLFGTGEGPTSPAAGEAALDLEVVHELAPGAREVVYEVGDPTRLAQAVEAMTAANPGAILSSSISDGEFDCEAVPGAPAYARTIDAVFRHAASLGTSIFWAAGDRGAYACLPSGIGSLQGDVSIMPEVASPSVTAVGGTTVFLSSTGAYFKEAAWGEPLEQWGGGGGVSTVFPPPSYQKAPGIPPQGYAGRGVPDVAANGDGSVSGWDVFMPPGANQQGPVEQPVGGTSAATPCWAAITALIDQDLHQLSLPPVGFANPGLYLFARHPHGLPAVAFHDVVEGGNLHYLATTGWDATTGLGTPDVAHLADDFEWFERNHRS